MSTYNNILFEVIDGIAYITLNRPENRNALTGEMKDELNSAIERVEKDKYIRVLVITGQENVFCAGGDIKKITQGLSPSEIRKLMEKSQVFLRKLVELEKPVIASVNGDAFGMGFNLALAADFIIASERARFCEVFIKIGAMPDFGALYFLPRLVGVLKTKALTYLGEVIRADEAQKMGLISEVVADEKLKSTTISLANQLARLPTKAIGRIKRLLNKTFYLSFEEVLKEEIESQIFLSKTRDFQEGMKAIIEKRKPVFHGE